MLSLVIGFLLLCMGWIIQLLPYMVFHKTVSTVCLRELTIKFSIFTWKWLEIYSKVYFLTSKAFGTNVNLISELKFSILVLYSNPGHPGFWYFIISK